MLALALVCAALHPAPLGTPLYAVRLQQPAMSMVQRVPIVDNILVRTLRRMLGRGRKKRIVCGDTKYGCDPRGPGDFVDEDLTEPAIPDDANFALAVPGVVGELNGGVAHLNVLLKDAGMERAVVLKFKRDGCPACNSTVAPLASAAAAYAGRADFVTVDYTKNRAFCKQCALAVVPCAHVYMGGQIAAALPLGPRAWAKFAMSLEEFVGAPEGELLAAEIPEDKNLPDARSVTGLDIFL